MTRPLLVPLDGSPLAERALPFAVQLALARRTRLVLFRAVLGPLPSGFDWERQQLLAVEEAEDDLAQVARRIAAPGLSVECAVSYGPAAAEMLKISRETDAAEVVMATHGRTGLSHLVYGSVAEAVLADSPIPVFLVHARPGQPTGPVFDPQAARVLVTLDGSAFAETALPAAVEFAGAGGELLLLRVMPMPERVDRDSRGEIIGYLDQLEEDARRAALAYLRGIVQRLERDAPSTRVRPMVRVGEPAPRIAEAATDAGAHLVVMATHGRTGLGRAILGSVAGKVLQWGATPLLLVHPPRPAAPPEPAFTESQLEAAAPFLSF